MSKSTISNKSQTDWERLAAMGDDDIDLSDIPELTPEMFAKAVVKRGLAEDYLEMRAQRGSKEKFLKAMSKVAKVEPPDYDRL